ncbi:MAG: hypothetical protein E6J45_08025 [Chloroflexi bacterium]|nr:MAG: hypothetical protein E6J45_08025 [Chloroflexota bacterium]
MVREDLVLFIRAHGYGVVATTGPGNQPEAALVGIAVSDALEIVFDTVATTRKLGNLRRDPRAAVVIGGGPHEESTLQCEGRADEPSGAELQRLKAVYFAQFPDGPAREAWDGIAYVRIRPQWMRYTDYTQTPALIVEAAIDDEGRPKG